MKVILLAAGQSKRVSPIVDKNFLSFCGRFLIEWQLNQLIQAGLNEFIVIGNKYNLEKLAEFLDEFKNIHDNKITIDLLEQKNLSDGMAGAIIECKGLVDDGPVLIVSSNDIVDISAYTDVITAQKHSDGALLGYKVDEYFPGGYMQLGHENKIDSIVEKPGAGNEPSDFVNIVVHLHNNYEVLKNAIMDVNTKKDDKYEVALDSLMNSSKYTMIPYNGFWQPLKFPWHIFELDKYFLNKRAEELIDSNEYNINEGSLIHKTAQISSSAVISGDVIIESGVKVFENAVIKGPAYIEEDSIIANNALVRDSFIGIKCVIGFSTEIARSHLGDNVWTHSNYIGDSIIGNNVSFGAGAITANLRLDEANIKWQGGTSPTNKLGLITGDHIRVGVNTSLMPGISIGSNSMIGSGLTICKDIDENKFVDGKHELKIKKNKINISDLLRD